MGAIEGISIEVRPNISEDRISPSESKMPAFAACRTRFNKPVKIYKRLYEMAQEKR